MPSGLLHDEHVRYYLPLDDLTEYTQDIAWTGDAGQFVPSIFTSGIDAPDTSVSLKHVLSPYDDMADASGFTCAVWTSGFFTNDSTFRYAQIGYANSSDSIRNALWFYKETSATGFRVYVEVNNVAQYKSWTPAPPNDPGWHLILVDGRYETSGWRHRVSLDGSGWVDLGVDTNAATSLADARVRVATAQGNSGVGFTLDELVLWADNDLFTNEEVSNLYELGDTHGKTMNEYTSTFGTPTSGDADLFAHGHILASGSTNLYIPGQKETADIILTIRTQTFASGDISLFTSANVPHSGSVDCYTHGHDPASGSINLYISGVPFVTNNIDNYILAHAVVSGDTSMFMAGRFPYMDAFVEVVENNPSDNCNLFVRGAASGESNLFYTNDTITFFIKDAGEISTTESEWSSFVKVADPIADNYSGTWQSFVKVGNTSNSTTNLYIQGHASGESPHGILDTGSINLFINGQSVQDGDEGLLSNGYYVGSSEVAAFAQVHLGTSGSVNMCISGAVLSTQCVSEFDLYTFGISGISSGSLNSYISGRELITDNCNLFTLGIQGVESGSCALYIEVTSTGLYDQDCILYAHGY